VGFKDSIFAQNLPADKAACYFHRCALLARAAAHMKSSPLKASAYRSAYSQLHFCSELDIKQCLISTFLN
jgi:hypothetical protein